MQDDDNHQRTIFYGESALSYIKRNTLPAYPRSYELWYTYSAGYNHGLNRAINSVIKEKGSVSTEEMQSIYGKYLAPTRLGDRINDVGSKVGEEVQSIVDTLKMSADATSDYGSSLERAGAKLGSLRDPKKLQLFVENMAQETRTAVSSNKELETQLRESKRQIEILQDSLEAIRYESLTDELTTLNNRKHFDHSLEQAIGQAKESGSSFALLLTDIDHFKKFNDTFGHQTGDQVLRLVALAVKHNVSNRDTACRYGGEEFAIILPQSQLAQAAKISEKIRVAVMSKELVKRSTGENLGRITVSIGISTFKPDDTAHSLIARADEALYAAKHGGRNMIMSEEDLKNTDDRIDSSEVA
ncbi:GGDEF domain-containing protein [Roseibium algae]|uniref:diguanylate cyclase n=1 Tax=Roseibium algae TaxID=3123038 RepID=A0ABU8TPB9_9HYPH